LVECLSTLLLERLPSEISQALLELLPEHDFSGLHRAAECRAETSIGYYDFVQKAATAVGVMGIEIERKNPPEETDLWKFSEKLVDSFLWSVAQEFPPELKAKMITHLPAELRHRMDLNLAHSDDSKVA
jgi:hypothetical protein